MIKYYFQCVMHHMYMTLIVKVLNMAVSSGRGRFLWEWIYVQKWSKILSGSSAVIEAEEALRLNYSEFSKIVIKICQWIPGEEFNW